MRMDAYTSPPTPAQEKSLAFLRIRTVRDLIERCNQDIERHNGGAHPTMPDVNLPYVTYKRYLVPFLKHRCSNLYVDFAELRRQKVILEGGAFPDQWIAVNPKVLRDTYGAPHARPDPARNFGDGAPSDAARRAMQRANVAAASDVVRETSSLLRAKDAEAEEERLFEEAVRRSREDLRETEAKHRELLTERAPIELCCPITLELFEDPVVTLHGQVYERQNIQAWLAKHDTDPMTGEKLRVKQLWPEEDLAHRCALYRQFA